MCHGARHLRAGGRGHFHLPPLPYSRGAHVAKRTAAKGRIRTYIVLEDETGPQENSALIGAEGAATHARAAAVLEDGGVDGGPGEAAGDNWRKEIVGVGVSVQSAPHTYVCLLHPLF